MQCSTATLSVKFLVPRIFTFRIRAKSLFFLKGEAEREGLGGKTYDKTSQIIIFYSCFNRMLEKEVTPRHRLWKAFLYVVTINSTKYG